MSRNIFEENKKSLEEIFSDNKKMILLINELERKMKDAATQFQFETASVYRDMIYSLNYLKTGIYGYKTMFLKDILLKIPITNGYKLFFVSKGKILLKSVFSTLTKDDIQGFINIGKDLKSSISSNLNEKSSMDYRDILYSEIKSLPDEMVIYL
ncbi:UvrB/UvrC motif-containing protein [Tissierella praeacuta]|uniref:UvrB/UvrC motif-containing protein n=1 Tax=Tissierella praeacuta TaxID=43131 RepID=UPI003340CA59